MRNEVHILWIKVCRYTSIFFCHYYKGNNLGDILFASVYEESFQKMGLLLKERICSYRSKFFPLRVNPIEKGGKNKDGRVASPKSVPIHLKNCKAHSYKQTVEIRSECSLELSDQGLPCFSTLYRTML